MELRGLSDHVARSVPGATRFDDGAAWGVTGLFKFQLERERPALWFELLGRPVDAVVFSAAARGFTLLREPTRALDPLGYLRGRVLELVAAAGVARASSRPPADAPDAKARS